MRRHRRPIVAIPRGGRLLALAVAVALGGVLGPWVAPPARAQLIDRRPEFPRPAREESPTDSLEKSWPGYPEALAMFAEIAAGRPQFAGQGWFRKAVSKTRFDWKSTASRLDLDRDGKLDRAEVKASEADFRRLDRDRDGKLTAPDFDFLGDARPEALGVEVFAYNAFKPADCDGDSRVTRAEWDELTRVRFADPLVRVILSRVAREVDTRFEVAAKAGLGFLSYADFQEAFTLTLKADMLSMLSAPRIFPMGRDAQNVMLRAFFRGDLGSMRPGPGVDALAPDFTLPTLDGKSEVTLSKLYATRPVVLVFGNFTCGPFRAHAGSLDGLRKRYGDRAHFVSVYTRESHPSDGWQMEENVASRVVLRQPRDLPERVDVAKTCRKTLGLEMPVVVDGMDDRVSGLYSGLPSRLYLIDRAGRIAYKGGRAPYGFKPAELEQSLLLLLNDDPGPERPRPR